LLIEKENVCNELFFGKIKKKKKEVPPLFSFLWLIFVVETPDISERRKEFRLQVPTRVSRISVLKGSTEAPSLLHLLRSTIELFTNCKTIRITL